MFTKHNPRPDDGSSLQAAKADPALNLCGCPICGAKLQALIQSHRSHSVLAWGAAEKDYGVRQRDPQPVGVKGLPHVTTD